MSNTHLCIFNSGSTYWILGIFASPHSSVISYQVIEQYKSRIEQTPYTCWNKLSTKLWHLMAENKNLYPISNRTPPPLHFQSINQPINQPNRIAIVNSQSFILHLLKRLNWQGWGSCGGRGSWVERWWWLERERGEKRREEKRVRREKSEKRVRKEEKWRKRKKKKNSWVQETAPPPPSESFKFPIKQSIHTSLPLT